MTASLVNAVIAVGVFVGAVFAPKLASHFRGGPLVLCAYLLPLLSLAGLILVEPIFMKIALLAPAMFLLPAESAVIGSIQMLSIPQQAIGRFMAATGLVELSLTALSTVLVSSLYQHFGFIVAITVSLVAAALSLTHLVATPELRNIPTSDKYEDYVRK